MFKMKTGLAA